jgi:hypothetical protein
VKRFFLLPGSYFYFTFVTVIGKSPEKNIINPFKMRKLLLLILVISGLNSSLNAQVVTIGNTSSPSSCDGWAILDSNVAFPTITWAGGGAIIQNGGYAVYNLCAGTYIVTYATVLGSSTSYTFSIGAGSGNPCSTLTMSVSPTYASSATACDGSAQIFASGGTAPYTYTWSNGLVGSLINNLCVGTYNCCVSDANGCVVCDSVSVLDSTGMDSILIFSNNPFPGASVSGTLSTQSVEDCTLDYQNVGSAMVTATTILSVDTVLVTWTLYDTTGNAILSYNVPYIIPVPSLGVYNLTLIVYCSQKSTNYNTIQVSDQILLGQNNLSMMQPNMLTFVNPFGSELKIQLNEHSVSLIQLLDMNGRVLNSLREPSIGNITWDTDNIHAGTYLLRVLGEFGSKTFQLIKQ